MDSLPNEIMENIADFLPPLGALQLTRTSKKLYSQFSLATTSRSKFLSEFSRDDCDDDMHYGFEIPTILQVSVHTLLVTMKWWDQGWGNRKGRLLLVAENKNQSYDRSGKKNGPDFGRVVYESRIAKHARRRLNITFKPKNNESYHIWYVVGGGGGHELNLYNMKIQALVFDESKSAIKAFNFLAKSNGLLPWDEKLPSPVQLGQLRRDSLTSAVLVSTSYLLEEGEPVLPTLASYFDSYGISESDLSLKFVESIKSALDDWAQQRCIYREHWKSELEAGRNALYYSRNELYYARSAFNEDIDDDESDSDEDESANNSSHQNLGEVASFTYEQLDSRPRLFRQMGFRSLLSFRFRRSRR